MIMGLSAIFRVSASFASINFIRVSSSVIYPATTIYPADILTFKS
jgi:hypothetical protein